MQVAHSAGDFTLQNDELCTKNDGCVLKMMNFVLYLMDFAELALYRAGVDTGIVVDIGLGTVRVFLLFYAVFLSFCAVFYYFMLFFYRFVLFSIVFMLFLCYT